MKMTNKEQANVVWVVDDDPDDQYLVKKVIASLDKPIDVRCFDSGVEFLDSINHQRPDVVLLDLNMPEINGMQALIKLKSNAQFKAIPVIIFSTSKSDRDIEEAYLNGACSFLSKEGSYQRLQEQIGAFCSYWFDTVSTP
jgi:CheY-like chemotaxis protein